MVNHKSFQPWSNGTIEPYCIMNDERTNELTIPMKPVILIVLDGFGIAPSGPGNAVHLAAPSNFTSFLHQYPNTTLKASGEAVGLPRGEVGNTEVGHINIGAGRIVYQDLPRINMSIADGSFYENPAFIKAAKHIEITKGALHIIGLIGAGTVHSSIDHLYALLYFAKENGLRQVFLHAITDGRDSPPKSALQMVQLIEERLKTSSNCRIASVIGRYYAMDRDHRWERTESAYRCLTQGEGLRSPSAREAIDTAYKQNKTDEFIEPTLIAESDASGNLIKEGDAVVFFNFRIDRPRQLTKAFVLDDFEKNANLSTSFDPYEVKYRKTHLHTEEETQSFNPPFQRGPKLANIVFVTMTEYEKGLPVEIAYPKIIVPNPLGRVISDHSLMQLRMSESEKERFVTYYFNGYRNLPFNHEDRLIIPSPKVATYDLKPEMAASEITNALIPHIASKKYHFILVNFANPDMVGHTGNIEATVAAVKAVDVCLGKIVQNALTYDTTVFITADHGNAEQKINPSTGAISTEHTDSPVPFLVVGKEYQGKARKIQTGILGDIAPTVLSEMGVQKPVDMTGRNLLEEINI